MTTADQEITVSMGALKIVWEHLGEGRFGDYNPDDSEDDPLMRFTVLIYSNKEKDYVPVEDGSYCTLIEVDKATAFELEILGQMILTSFKNSTNPKRTLEAASWLTI